MAIQQSTPSVVRTGTTRNYLTSQDVVNSLKPDVDSELYRRFGSQDLSGMLEMIGNKEAVDQIEYFHFEEDFIHEIIKCNSSATGPAGAPVTLTVASSYSFDETGSSPYISTNTTTVTMPRPQDVLIIPNSAGTAKVEAIVTRVQGVNTTSLSANQFEVYPVVSGEAIPAVTTDTEIPVTGSAYGEGSDGAEPRNTRFIEYKNNLQILKGKVEATGTAARSVMWVDNLGDSGEPYWYLEAALAERKRVMNEVEMQLLTGQRVTNTTFANNANTDQTTVSKTEGVIPQIENNGNVSTYTVGSFSMADIDDMTTLLDKYRGARENTVFTGFDLGNEISDLFREDTNLKNGGVVFNAFDGIEKQGINLDFEYFRKNDYKFARKNVQLFSDENTLGAAGLDYRNIGIVIPMDNSTIYESGLGGTSVDLPSVSIKYLKDREYVEWVTGVEFYNGEPTFTDDVDKFRINYMCHKGLELRGLNRFGLFKKA